MRGTDPPCEQAQMRDTHQRREINPVACLSAAKPHADSRTFRLDRIFALDQRLTRQFEKTFTMLIRLREMRPAGPTTA
jgi:hypothetical protein